MVVNTNTTIIKFCMVNVCTLHGPLTLNTWLIEFFVINIDPSHSQLMHNTWLILIFHVVNFKHG